MPRNWYLKVGFWLLVTVIVLFSVFPFYYAILTSLKSGSALFSVEYIPVIFDLTNYAQVFEGSSFGRNLFNSVLVSTAVVALSLLLGVTASYALGRIKFRGRNIVLLTILGVSMFPQVAVLSGLFELIRAFGLYNSMPGLVLAYMIFTLPFTVWY